MGEEWATELKAVTAIQGTGCKCLSSDWKSDSPAGGMKWKWLIRVEPGAGVEPATY